MNWLRMSLALVLSTLLLLGGCATRPINAPITEFIPDKGYQYLARQQHSKDHDNLVILAFSGGGTRAGTRHDTRYLARLDRSPIKGC